MSLNIHHLSLKVASGSFDKTVQFYRDVIGLSIARVQDGAVFLSCGSILLEILQIDEMLSPVGILNHFAFAVDNVEGMLRRVADAGYEVTMQPRDHTFGGDSPYKVHIAFFRGPAGESVELFQEI